MRYYSVIVALAIATAAAGCVNEEESSDERSRGFSVAIPDDVVRLEVDITARSEQAARVQVEIEREDGTDIAEDNFEMSGGTAIGTVSADVTGADTVWILVTVAEGDATVDVTVRGVRAEGEPIVIRHETLIIVISPPPTSTPADTPPATTPPTSTPPVETTPTPTPETNTTPTDNNTNTTANETNETP